MLLLAALLAFGDSLPVASSDTASPYWQQQVAYRITATLDEASGVLSGHERITYVNRSPDVLSEFYVHQYLNAFRPGSRWGAVDQSEGRVRFQRLTEPDFAFERISRSSVMGEARAPDYPFAPDSTIAHWALPHPLLPGDSLTVEIDWQARPSTLPRRQGRRGRRFDFAQWYPKVVVYDRYGWEAHPLYPAGEFYGEFATYDVTLDLPQDQVIGATGVPVCGDPGWEKARAEPGVRVDYQRDYYGRVPNDCPPPAAPGRKTVRFRAEQVHHFAFSLNPEYVYEQGRYKDVTVHVLYQPADRATWGGGIAVGHTETALAWLDSLYGPFAWPQLTNVHRIEGGGTEFPMMVMNGSAGLGLILHEVGHNYTMGILANNEWREGYLDEGFTSFQTAWYEATHGIGDDFPSLEAGILLDDVDRWSEPVSTVSERFRDFFIYNEMIYNKAELFYDELRYVVGDDTMRQILRTYYARWKLKHVDEDAFRAVCEEVSHQDLKWLFAEWLHATPLIDYKLERVERRRGSDGRWHIAVTVRRLGDGVMPLEIGDQHHVYARTVGQAEIERVEFIADSAPGRLMLDPRVVAHDWNMLNNREPKGLFRNRGASELRFDNPTKDVVRRDRATSAILPVAWSNDEGGATIGVRFRGNYLGRFDRALLLVSQNTRHVTSHPDGIYFRMADPVQHLIPRTSTAVAAWEVEGRAGLQFSWDRSLRQRWVDRADPHSGFDALWMATTNKAYLDRGRWDDAGTVEAGPWMSSTWLVGRSTMSGRVGFHGGIVYRYPGPGIVTEHRYDLEPFLRGTAQLSTRLPFWLGTTIGLRGFAGGYWAHSPPPAQRRIYVAGADPYETFTNPLLRSRGALFVRPDFFYQAPGDANLRGFAPQLGGRWAVSGTVELSRTIFTLPRAPVRAVALHLFGDGGLVDSAAAASYTPGKAVTPLWDAGAGAVATAQIGDLSWTVRFDVPWLVSRWNFAADPHGRDRRAQFRWLVSLEPSF
jgi:hypothetical protein